MTIKDAYHRLKELRGFVEDTIVSVRPAACGVGYVAYTADGRYCLVTGRWESKSRERAPERYGHHDRG